MYMYLRLKGRVLVSAAASLETYGCLFLALVATAPELQRKAYREAVRVAKATGWTLLALHATMAGAPVHERIG
jgi:hypothetical protein